MRIALLYRICCLLLCLCLLCGQTFAQQKTGYHTLRTLPITGAGGWDYLTVSHALDRIYVSHGSKVIVLKLAGGDSSGFIPANRVHGIALAEAFGKGYISNGGSGKVSIFDLKTNKVLSEVQVGKNPDAIFYDDFSRKVYVFNGGSKDASVIDAASDKVVASIPLGAKPETGVSDGKGNVFVNAEDTNEVLEIDTRNYHVKHRYKIKGGDEPSGLDIDRKTGRLFIGCGGSKTMVIMDATNGNCLAHLTIGGCDGLVFDPALKLAFSSNGEGTLSVVKENSASSFNFVENIATEKSARTIAIDLQTHRLYLPAARTQPNPAGGYPRVIPGTFHVLEVGR